jgi:hypothetical protein
VVRALRSLRSCHAGRPTAAPLLAALLFVTAGLLACSNKKAKPVEEDAGPPEILVEQAPAEKADPALVKARLEATCGDAAVCACMKERFGERYSDSAIAVMAAGSVSTVLREIQEDCELRTGKLRDGVIGTCMDGDEGARAVCECAADAFLKQASATQLYEILDRGWDRDTAGALAYEKRICAGKK